MSPYYYICQVLKIVHTNGVSLIKLSQEPSYSQPYDDEDHSYTREYESERIYKKGEQQYFLEYYIDLIQEFIKSGAEPEYESTNEIIQKNSFFSHDVNAESLHHIDDIIELYLVEIRD